MGDLGGDILLRRLSRALTCPNGEALLHPPAPTGQVALDDFGGPVAVQIQPHRNDELVLCRHREQVPRAASRLVQPYDDLRYIGNPINQSGEPQRAGRRAPALALPRRRRCPVRRPASPTPATPSRPRPAGPTARTAARPRRYRTRPARTTTKFLKRWRSPARPPRPCPASRLLPGPRPAPLRVHVYAHKASIIRSMLSDFELGSSRNSASHATVDCPMSWREATVVNHSNNDYNDHPNRERNDEIYGRTLTSIAEEYGEQAAIAAGIAAGPDTFGLDEGSGSKRLDPPALRSHTAGRMIIL